MQKSVKIVGGEILITHGSEGPSHDPYSYTKLTVRRDGVETVFHAGLGCYVEEWGGERIYECDADLDLLFEQITGYTPAYWFNCFERAVKRYRTRCPAGGRHKLRSASGYVGETVTWCEKDGCRYSEDDFHISMIE